MEDDLRQAIENEYEEHNTQGFYLLQKPLSDDQAINVARSYGAKIWFNETQSMWVILDQKRSPALWLAWYASEAAAAHAFLDYYRLNALEYSN